MQQQLAPPSQTSFSPTRMLRQMPRVEKKPAKMSREERMTLREKRADKRKVQQMVEEIVKAQEQTIADGINEAAKVNIDSMEDEEGEDVDKASRSPIKLLLRIGPDGPTGTNLFIDNQLVDKKTSDYSNTQTSDHLNAQTSDHLNAQTSDHLNKQAFAQTTDASDTAAQTTIKMIDVQPVDNSVANIKNPSRSEGSLENTATEREIAVANLLTDIASLIH